MKKRKKLSTGTLLVRYRDPLKPSSLGGLTGFAKANKITVKRAREVLERDLGYTLHKPRRRRFPTTPVVVFEIVEQWTADLIEVINRFQVQSRVPLPLAGGGRLLKVRLGSTREKQDGSSRDGGIREDLERRWQGILQLDLLSLNETERHSSLFDQR